MASVKCDFSTDKFHKSQVSIVPKASNPFSARFLALLTLSRIHAIFVAEKYGSKVSPVFSDIIGSKSSPFNLLQNSVVRLSCQTIAL